MGFVNAHFVAYAQDLGASTIAAAGALATVGVTGVIGALTFGNMADRRNPRHVLAVAYSFRGIGYVFLLLAPNLWIATLGVMIIGASWTSVISLTGAVSADQFGLKRLGTVYGTIFGIMPLGAASGVWIAGRMYDTQGNYDIALAAAMIVGLASAILIGIPKYRQLAPEVKTTQSAIPSIAD
ncbi:MAG: MFS transporter [Dehalococcoidia bacterium]